MYYLLYQSIANKELKAEDLTQILREARERNKERQVTGLLLFAEMVGPTSNESCFYQVLEGAKEDVLFIFDKIKKDDRHHSIVVLEEGNIEKRHFEYWNMGLQVISNQSEMPSAFNLDVMKSYYTN